MSDRTSRIEAEQWTASLSLVVNPVDGFTGDGPVRGSVVRLESADADPVTTRSGYRVFLDLPAGSVTVVVDGGDRYLDERRENVDVIDLSDPNTEVDPTDVATLPVETIELHPAPAYQFPSGATVLRGVVRDASENPVSGATVAIRDIDRAVETDETGEFVLFVDVQSNDDVTVEEDGAVMVDENVPMVDVNHPIYGPLSESIDVSEGALVSATLRYP